MKRTIPAIMVATALLSGMVLCLAAAPKDTKPQAQQDIQKQPATGAATQESGKDKEDNDKAVPEALLNAAKQSLVRVEIWYKKDLTEPTATSSRNWRVSRIYGQYVDEKRPEETTALVLDADGRVLLLDDGLEDRFLDKIIIKTPTGQSLPAKRVKLLRRMLSLTHPDVDATLKNLLNDPNPTVRFTSAKELAERGDPSAIPFLAQALNHTDDFVRFGAIRALGHIEAVETIEPLISALDDSLAGNAEWAAKYLRARTGQDFGFKADLARAETTRIMISWKMWWENNRARLAAEPPVVARVLAARSGSGKVLLKLVTGGPIKTGMRLNVYRGGKVVGYIRISQVMEAGMAEGTMLKWLLRKPIRAGDQLRNLAAANAREGTET